MVAPARMAAKREREMARVRSLLEMGLGREEVWGSEREEMLAGKVGMVVGVVVVAEGGGGGEG